MNAHLLVPALVLLASLLSCAPNINPTPQSDTHKLPPTDKSVSKYLALHVTDNRSSFRKMALVADQGRTDQSSGKSSDANSLSAVNKAIELGLEFVRIDVRRIGNNNYCTDHIADGEEYPFFEHILSACRGKVFICMDATKSLHIPNTCSLIDSLSMQDEIIFFMGDLGGPGDNQEDSYGWRNYLAFSSRLDKVVPLFTANSKEAVDFVERQDLPVVVSFITDDLSMADYCHSYGFAVYTDISSKDADIKNGDNTALKQAAAIKADLVCTGIANNDNVISYLNSNNLNK